MAAEIHPTTHASGAATTDITPCKLLRRISVNTPATGAITVSDGTPGATIAVINSTTGVEPFQMWYDTPIASNNLRVVTQAGQDITIHWE